MALYLDGKSSLEDTLENKDIFSSEKLNRYLVNERYNFTDFIDEEFSNFEYDILQNKFTQLCKKNNLNITDILVGNVGGLHNKRMAISIFPTWNLFKIIVSIMNKLSLNNLQEVNAGIGLNWYIFQKFNGYLLRTEHEKRARPYELSRLNALHSISAIDSGYELEYGMKLNNTQVEEKDMFDLIMTANHDLNKAYLCVNPIISSSIDTFKLIKTFCNLRKPKLFMIIGNHKNIDEGILNYSCTIINPKIISLNDTLNYNLGSSTNFKMYIFVRTDEAPLFEILNTNIFDDIKNHSMNWLHRALELKNIPEHLIDSNEEYVKKLMHKMYKNKMLKLPLHLKDVDEIDSYIWLYEHSVDISNGKIPDILQKRDNFLNLRKYIDMLFNDFASLKRQGVIPTTINNPTDANYFLVLDYAYSDKIETKVCFKYVNNYNT